MEPPKVERGDEAGLDRGEVTSASPHAPQDLDRAPENRLPRQGGAARRLTAAHAATVAGVVGITLTLQMAVLRLSGIVAPFALLLAGLVAVSLVQGALAWGLGGRAGERPWCAALVLLPPLSAALPALDRLGGGFGLALVALAIMASGAVVALASRWRLFPARPLACALLAAASGIAVAAATSAGQLEAPLVVLGRGALILLAATGLAGLIGLAWSLPEGTPPLRPLRISLAVAGAGLLLAAGLTSSAELPLAGPATAPANPATSAKPAKPAKPAGADIAGSRPPIVLIVLDSVRADHLASYGYRRDTMPALERFARSHTVRVERTLASSPASLETHASLFTGLLATRHGAHRPPSQGPSPAESATPLPREVPTLAALLQRAGYWTVGLAANYGPLGPSLGLGRGFAEYRTGPGWRQRPAVLDPYRFALARRWPLAALDRLPPFRGSDFFSLSTPYRRGAEMVEAAEEAVERAGDRPFFLFLNLMDAHFPYRPPRSAGRPYPAAGRPGWSPLADPAKAADEIMAGKRREREEEHAAWIDGYDGALRSLDTALAPFLARLARHPRFAEMMVVITADHGEAFGEHGLYRHSTSLYDEMLRVPLFLKPGSGPRRPAGFEPGTTLPGPFQSVDLFPTVLRHAGVEGPKAIDGTPWARGRQAAVAEAYAHAPSAKLGERFRRDQRAIEVGGWKLISGSDGGVELYDLVRDPLERRNLAAQDPVRVRSLGEALREVFAGPASVARPPIAAPLAAGGPPDRGPNG